MKYLALLSGGKDSCYNIVHCAQSGHELVAAASLGPEPGKEELDSYLYQTVGQDAIEFVARALEVPLYRRVITGDAVEQGSEYGGRNANDAGGVAGDETEDLFELLSTAKVHHPDVKGVSVGAILSNYQRVRVEHVCHRLNLTPLCYLWQRNQGELLAEMIKAGMEAILIKVAGIGLTISHLGKSIAQMEPILSKLNTLYGSHICGEGGEYETLTLDCPLFKKSIRLTEMETVVSSDSDLATVAFLRVKGAELEAKSSFSYTVTTPPLLEKEFEFIQDAVLKSQSESLPCTHGVPELFHHPTVPLCKSIRKNSWISIANIQAMLSADEDDLSIEEEVTQCFYALAERLADHGLTMAQCSFISIFISSMDLFQRVNAVYSTFFGISPPARACVGIDLPDGIRVRMESIAFVEETPFDRQALHVQSLSYWAPANIGPYSQAIISAERVFLSGQIGLVPSQLALPSPPSLPMELALASQHISRVTSALRETSGGDWEGYTQLAIYWMTEPNDLCHIKRGHLALQPCDYPALFVVVKQLPKDALVEKQVLLHTGKCLVIDEDDGEAAVANCVPSCVKGPSKPSDLEDGQGFHWEFSSFKEDGSSCALIYAKGDLRNSEAPFRELSSKVSLIGASLSVRYFYRRGTNSNMEHLAHCIFGQYIPPITPVPCRMISSLFTDNWDQVFCIVTSSGSQ